MTKAQRLRTLLQTVYCQDTNAYLEARQLADEVIQELDKLQHENARLLVHLARVDHNLNELIERTKKGS